MKPVKVIRKSDQAVIVSEGKVADTFFTRLRGLIGVKKFNTGEGMLFPDCNNVHMWMMSIPIDVVFLKATINASEKEVVKVCPRIKPWKMLPVMANDANDALELPAGTIERFQIKNGEVLCTAS